MRDIVDSEPVTLTEDARRAVTSAIRGRAIETHDRAK